MRRFIVFLTALLFFIWILPLGVFIKPSQEKLACNGQRLICLCSLKGKMRQKNGGKILFQNASGPHKEEGSPGGASHYFVSAKNKDHANNRLFRYFDQQSFLYSFLINRSIEHVPKNNLS